MVSPTRPVLVYVPGAFGTPRGFQPLEPHLNNLETYPGGYPSCNPPDPLNASCANDIASLRSVLHSLLDQHKDVVILAHSYGGVVAGGAAKGLDRDTRKALGHQSAVVGLFYIAGNISLDGESLLECIGGTYPPFIKLGTPSGGLAVIEPAMEILYNDCDPGLQSELDQLMNPHALRAFETKPSAPAWADKGFDKRRAYVRTLRDNCLPASLQTSWIEKSNVEWDVLDLDAGHMPFASQPKSLAELVVRFVQRLATL